MRRHRPTLPRLIDDGAAQLFPGYFAVVMATGALSIAAHLLAMGWLAWPLLVAGTLAYAVLCALTLIRLLRYPRRLAADMVDHARGPGFFTIVAGTCILGSQYLLIAGNAIVAHALWLLGISVWLVVMYWFFVAVTVRQRKPTLESGINGAWLLASVATQSIAVLTTLMPWSGDAQTVALFFALCMFLLGCMLYLAIIPLIFYRLTFVRLTMAALTPPYWINMGAVAITTLAGSTLILRTTPGGLLVDFLPFLKGFTLFFWAAATWWIPLLIGLTAWRHLAARHPLAYDPQLWGMVFPLAMYTTGTLRLSDALALPFLTLIPQVTVWVALIAWLGTTTAMCLHLARRYQPTADITAAR